jgi:hypothetical protein
VGRQPLRGEVDRDVAALPALEEAHVRRGSASGHRGRPRRAASSESIGVARLSTPCGRRSAPAAVTARWIAAATPGAGNVGGRADSARVAMGASSGQRAGIPSVARRDGDRINAK